MILDEALEAQVHSRALLTGSHFLQNYTHLRARPLMLRLIQVLGSRRNRTEIQVTLFPSTVR